jgi:hypothetical protein
LQHNILNISETKSKGIDYTHSKHHKNNVYTTKKIEKKKRKILLDDRSYNAKLLGLALEKKTKEVVDPLSL